ncbi:acetyltransferase (GNAT) domain-containing protein [Sarocladium implicatum]|nr:acetyltransferase (GNAT) domain-containing protein [Sarocladium implicatum]
MASSNTREFTHMNTVLTSPSHPIRLQNLHARDAAGFAHILAVDANDGKPPRDLERARAGIEKLNTSASAPSILSTPTGARLSGPKNVNLFVVVPRDGESQSEGEADYEVIGLGGFGAIKTFHRDGKEVSAGDAGIVLDPKYRGKGYAVEAMKLTVDWAFRSLKEGGLQLDLVTITTRSDNDAMIRLTNEKLGLKGRGVLRDGEFSDKEWYWEVNAEDWQSLQA